MMVAQRFVKQYYQVLSTDPENIGNFYKAPSLYSHGQGNEPTTPAKFRELSNDLLKDRLFSDGYQLDLEYGAIDAQDSLGGGVLVVVTGHLVVEEQRRAFCHTFFLNPYSPPDAKKKQFYVHNDIMRFLHDGAKEDGAETEEEKEVTETVIEESNVVENVEAPPETTDESAATPPADIVPSETVVDEPVVEPQTVSEPESVEKEVDEPEAAVEETKEDIVTERDNKSKRKGKSKRKKSPSPDKAQPSPESWASMVAHTASSPAPPSPTRKNKETTDVPPAKEEKPEKPVEHKEQQHKQGKQQQKRLRDPDCTLVIKHVPENAKERDVRDMFEPYAKQTNSRIVGLNVQAFKNLAFVDYDSPEPVLLALKETKTFRLGNRNLELEPKMVDKNRPKGSSGRYNRGQGGDGSNGFRGSGRSGQHRRRGSGGGRGDRGSTGRGGRGGR